MTISGVLRHMQQNKHEKRCLNRAETASVKFESYSYASLKI